MFLTASSRTLHAKALYPFEKFTEQAKKTLTLAQKEAERSHHSYIGTEHLLLGILSNKEGSGHRALASLEIQIDVVRATIEAVLGRNERIIIQQIIPTSRVKKVIEISFEEARRLGSNYVDTGHLLLGIVLEGEGIAAHVLMDLGATPAVVTEAVLRELGASRETAAITFIDRQAYREVMATFPSGVVVLTAFGDDYRPGGLTVSAFCAVSLEPPLALVCIDKTSNTLPAVQHTRGFTANILAAGREELARRMATKVTDKFEGLAWGKPESEIGGPILMNDSAAYAVCTLRDTIEAGDHWVLIGFVTEGRHIEGVKPLVFSRRTYK